MAKDPTPAADDAATPAETDVPTLVTDGKETLKPKLVLGEPAFVAEVPAAVAPVAEEAPASEERPADVVLRCPRCKSALRLEPTGTGLCLPCGGLRYDLATLPR